MWNETVQQLKPYPMEELATIRRQLREQGRKVYDFGTGDPKIPLWPPINECLRNALPKISQYPSVRGSDQLLAAISDYLKRRFQLQNPDELMVIPSGGSKEAIFHLALCLVGRAGGRRHIMYPNPGYPVYRNACKFAGGIPYPLELRSENQYRIEPWSAPEAVIKDTAALWINYPHNPTGTCLDRDYLQQLIDWCQSNNILLLSDDCYIDIYNDDPKTGIEAPINPLELATDGILSFMSLSKRSGLTGYRSGCIVGPKTLMQGLLRARANFGVGTPEFIQEAAACAWLDDSHVEQRRKIFIDRLQLAYRELAPSGLIEQMPQASFYLWLRTPNDCDDIEFCRTLAQSGIIASPSQWLGEGTRGYFRLAMVPETADLIEALAILKSII